ncbi:MAG: hypothetical protein R6X02_20185 [Enhygromyxa sp.]
MTASENTIEELAEVGNNLSQGESLIRFSLGMRGRDRKVIPNVHSVSIRFGAERGEQFEPRGDAQDLMLMTAQRVVTMPIAALATKQENFAGDIYHGGAPFEIDERPNMLLRLVPLGHVDTTGKDPFQNLRQAVEDGEVSFRLETSMMSQPNKWFPLVDIQLADEVVIDDTRIEFQPFRTGRGIVPQGFVHYTRQVPYLMSEYARKV